MHSTSSSPSLHDDSSAQSSQPPPVARSQVSVVSSAFNTVLHHFQKHVGVGIICAVGYFDPGNWTVDIQAGTTFGYRPMLFVILLAGIIAIILQVLAARLGCVTGLDLAHHCRLLLHDHPRHPRLVRRLVLYPLYALSEIAIISTDLAELLGSAIGICLLFPKLPLWSSVLITGVDVFIFLIVGDPSRTGRPVRFFELVIIVLVAVVFICFILLLVKVHPDWPQVFLGFVPSAGLLQTDPNAVYTAIGIIGATVMPHGLFLGSNLATQDRVSQPPQSLPTPADARRPSFFQRFERFWRDIIYFSRSERDNEKDYTSPHGLRQNNSIEFIRAHLGHGTVDLIFSLLGLAVPINSAILVLAAAMFYSSDNNDSIGLVTMHTLMLQSLGAAAALMFALALICSGQTASVTATLAGQIVSEGFISWNISPFVRRLLTRLISLIPSIVVAVASGGAGINALLIASQVILSIVLPFVAFPLIYLTSSKTVMSVRIPKVVQEKLIDTLPIPSTHAVSLVPDPLSTHQPPLPVTTGIAVVERNIESHDDSIKHSSTQTCETEEYDVIDFSNGYIVTVLAWAIWVVILIANVYAIVMLAMGETGQ
ncbi:natural resistance-associated macrophage protein-domain-containing protein [Suillus subaureus]|uniref:Natural resistance-associated macrophage protein-domain-containing protein n=1 Tax=Suillus subaureus TaxID=48587 RepID=A0A9P7EMR2_9AGAM|nr:natural resistance-associated macrophage protein-domain-containing protein [Suillus subaureus]KAG1826250.1 natural resistance-associated macrophage protein-domain-containing protein [Suillus subaureus]